MKIVQTRPGHDLALLLARLAIGLPLIAGHGLPKLLRFSEISGNFTDPYGIGPLASLLLVVGAETLLAFLLMSGFATRLTGIPIAFTMFTAAFVVHGDDLLGNGEKALLYLFLTLIVLLTGPGRWSLDALARPVWRRLLGEPWTARITGTVAADTFRFDEPD